MNTLIHLITNALALLVTSYIVPGFVFSDARALIVTVIVMGVVNAFIKPVVQIIALPISVLTLGIFAFVVNVALLFLVSYIVPGFEIMDITTGAIAAIVLALVGAFFNRVSKEK